MSFVSNIYIIKLSFLQIVSINKTRKSTITNLEKYIKIIYIVIYIIKLREINKKI